MVLGFRGLHATTPPVGPSPHASRLLRRCVPDSMIPPRFKGLRALPMLRSASRLPRQSVWVRQAAFSAESSLSTGLRGSKGVGEPEACRFDSAESERAAGSGRRATAWPTRKPGIVTMAGSLRSPDGYGTYRTASDHQGSQLARGYLGQSRRFCARFVGGGRDACVWGTHRGRLGRYESSGWGGRS